MKKLIVAALLLASAGLAQTLGQFRILDFSPKTAAVVTATSYDSAGIHLTVTPGSFTLHNGDAVYIQPMYTWAQDQVQPGPITLGNHGNRGRGYFTVSVTDQSHITLTNEMYTTKPPGYASITSGSWAQGVQWIYVSSLTGFNIGDSITISGIAALAGTFTITQLDATYNGIGYVKTTDPQSQYATGTITDTTTSTAQSVIWTVYQPATATVNVADASNFTMGNEIVVNTGTKYDVDTYITGLTATSISYTVYNNPGAAPTSGTVYAYPIKVADHVIPLTTYYLREGPRLYLDGPVNKGSWNSGTAYKPLEMVSYTDGNSYECTTNTGCAAADVPTDTANWKQINPALVGPGTFTAAVRDTSATGRANSNNLAYTQAVYMVNTYWGGAHTYDYSNQLFFNGSFGSLAAWLWLATGSSTYWNDAQYLYSRAEDLASGTPACIESMGESFCGSRQQKYDVDNSRAQTEIWAAALGAVYESLSTAQKQALADRLLNDNSTTRNGTDTTDCVNNGYIPSDLGKMTVLHQVATVASGLSGLVAQGLGPGSVILQQYPYVSDMYEVVGRVKSVDSDTQLTFETGQGSSQIASGSFSNFQQWDGQWWWWTKPFGYSGEKTCGVMWFEKHHASSPRLIPGQETQYGKEYKWIGATQDDSPRQNKVTVAMEAYIPVALLLGDFDLRAVRLGEQAINYYVSQNLAQESKSRFPGVNGHGTQYGPERVDEPDVAVARMIQNSLTVTPPGFTTGGYIKSAMGQYMYAVLNNDPLHVIPWSTGYPYGSGDLKSERLSTIGATIMHEALLYPSDPMAGVVWDYLRNRRSDYGCIVNGPSCPAMDGGWGSEFFVSYAWPLYNPGATKTSITTFPLQRAFFTTDINECIASGLYCRPDSGEAIAHSVTGWGSSDTQVTVHGSATIPIWDDGNYGEAGSFNIVQNNGTLSTFLLGGNGLGDSGLGWSKTPAGGLWDANGLSIWKNSDLYNSGYYFAQMDRWAGDPTTGVSDNSYTYDRVNYTPKVRDAAHGYDPAQTTQESFFGSTSGAQNVTTEMFHLKSGSGLPNYVVVYDYCSLSVNTNQCRHYWHLQDSDASAVLHTDWVTFDHAGKAATLIPSGASARMNMKALSISGSANSTVALVSEDYAPTDGWYAQESNITGASWSSGTETLTYQSDQNPFLSQAFPLDGSKSITIKFALPSAINGTYPATGWNGTSHTVSFPIASDPGWTSGGKIVWPPWCTYVTTYNPNGTCVGQYNRPDNPLPDASFPGTYRLTECGSSDGLTCDGEANTEMAAVFQPTTNTTATMPTIAQPSCTGSGGSCATIEIQDATYPKVVAVGRKGALLTGMAFTTTHAGVGGYAVSGLAPGTYNATVNGAHVQTATVTSADTTMSFNSTPGSVVITQTGAAALLVASPSSLSFSCTSAGTASAAQTVALSMSDSSAVSVTVAPDAFTDFVGVAPGSLTTPASITITPSCAGKSSGNTYSGNVLISGTAGNSPLSIPVTLTYYAALAITPSSLPGVTQGSSYSQLLGASGGLGPYTWSLTTGSLPTGLTMSSGGLISGTPSAAGTYNFTVQVTDSESTAQTASKAYSIVVSASSGITMNLTPNPVAVACSSPTQAISFTSSGGALTSWAATKALAILSLSAASGTAAANFSATLNCHGLKTGQPLSDTITVSSPNAPTVQVPVTISVDGPTVSTSSFTAANWANTYSQAVAAAGGSGAYTWTASGLPIGLTISADGTISGVPMIAGSYTVQVQATDSNGVISQSQAIPLNVAFLPASLVLGGSAQTSGSGH